MDLIDSTPLVANLVECLEDTYEFNQQRALQLLQSMPALTLKQSLPDSLLHEILQKAFRYLYSSRTQDCMSAAYLILSTFVDAQRSLTVLHQFNVQCDMNFTFECLSLDICTDNVTEELSIALIQAVLTVIRHQVSQAKEDLVLASQKCPLYPAMMSLRYLLRKAELTDVSRWASLIEQVFEVIYKDIHPLVAPVVCHSSPEGYLPPQENGGEENSEGRRPGLPQYLVVCCWRTVKEISLVYGAIMEKMAPTEPNIVSKSQICLYIRSFYEYILLRAKHRGAFEMAYTGYCSYWHTIWRMKCCQDWVSSFLTDSPYAMLLSADSADDLCATRRSAGLPFMVQAYVSTEPRLNNNSSLKAILNALLPMSFGSSADNTANYSQVQRVHALNVLRSLYKCSSLGDAVLPFVSEGLKSAIAGYKSQIWPVRNASTLLFSALITRMFGVKQGKDDLSKQSGMAGRLFFQRYPAVHSFLVQEFEACTEFRASDNQTLLQPSLYLLLIVLCKLYPSQKESADINLSLDVFVPYLYRCASSPVYKARMLAALALSNILGHDDIAETMTYLCNSVSNCHEHNRLHGLLLQIYHLYMNMHMKSSNAAEAVAIMLMSDTQAIMSSPCDVVKASYIDVLRVAKPYMHVKYPQDLPPVLNTALNLSLVIPAASTSAPNVQPSTPRIWVGDSVDLQLSRGRLLLDPCEPVVCTRQILLELLSESCMYELHHIILSSSLVKGTNLLSHTDLLTVFAHMVQLNNSHLSFNTTYSIDLLAERISDVCLSTEVSPALVVRQKHLIDCIGWEKPSLFILKLKTCLYKLESSSPETTHRHKLAEMLYQILSYLKGDDVDSPGLSLCIEVLRLLGDVTLGEQKETGKTAPDDIPQNYWIAWILLIFNIDVSISTQACAAVGTMLLAQGYSSHSDLDPCHSLCLVLHCMSTVYGKERVRGMWTGWLNDANMWLPQSAVCDTENVGERLFSKGEGLLLCDPQSFHGTLKQLLAPL